MSPRGQYTLVRAANAFWVADSPFSLNEDFFPTIKGLVSPEKGAGFMVALMETPLPLNRTRGA